MVNFQPTTRTPELQSLTALEPIPPDRPIPMIFIFPSSLWRNMGSTFLEYIPGNPKDSKYIQKIRLAIPQVFQLFTIASVELNLVTGLTMFSEDGPLKVAVVVSRSQTTRIIAIHRREGWITDIVVVLKYKRLPLVVMFSAILLLHFVLVLWSHWVPKSIDLITARFAFVALQALLITLLIG
ncbi:hypothetical protein TWF730_006168 [Orbilia blumenaviensis]|uniref:Uncharacterized protein n=1 Tax=Orbilia blumenaviensis TaxID=1796055 RepID=A0AAV9TWD9_9PEZI